MSSTRTSNPKHNTATTVDQTREILAEERLVFSVDILPNDATAFNYAFAGSE